MSDRQELRNHLLQHSEFAPFLRIVDSLESELAISQSMYTGVFCDYYAELNNNVIWDLELVNSGIEKLNIRTTDNILDVCCGDGRLGIYLMNKGYSVVGIDSSQEQINKAIQADIQSKGTWQVGNVLVTNDMNRNFKNLSISAIVTSAAAINSFLSVSDLELFFTSMYEVGKSRTKHLFIPVFSKEAVNFFYQFQGEVISQPFNHLGKTLIMWTSLLFDAENRLLKQPLFTVSPNGESLSYQFCYEVSRIWSDSEVEEIAQNTGWKKTLSIPSEVVGGGANKLGFTLLILESKED